MNQSSYSPDSYNQDDYNKNNYDLVQKVSTFMAYVVADIGSKQFLSSLSKALEKIVAYDSLMIVRFAAKPVVEHIQYPLEAFPDEIEEYTKGAYLLDPFYQAAVDQDFRGFAALDAFAPEGYNSTEYFKQHYKKTGLGDECGYIIDLGDGQLLNIALNQLVKNSPFVGPETDILKSIYPLVESICQMHWKIINTQHTSTKSFNTPIEQALANFAIAKLTPRESEVVHFILKGLPGRSIASKMNISIETVKIHRKNSYKKLGIKSQSELFNLFIKSLQFDEHQAALSL